MDTTNLADVGKLTEDQARAHLEGIRWPNGAACPRCGDTAVTKLQGKSTRPGVYKCKGCRKPFTVTVGTIFEDSHIPLAKWVMAFHLMCSSKKGISALQLQRNLGLGSYKSAWHMAHRIRHAMRSEPLASMLAGVVECDEAWIGGRPRFPQKQKGGPKRAKWSSKAPVMVLVERGGRARAKPLKIVTSYTLKKEIRENVDPSSTLMTDEHSGYFGIGREFTGGHHTTNHLRREYLRGPVHSNTAESFFALLKRGVHGTFHHVSKPHLFRYCDEFSFRWDYRKTTDAERTTAALRQTDGKRLAYRAMKQPA